MIKFTVYKILNLTTNEYYIGVHKTSNPNDNYLGSGLHIKNQVKKYGKENFKKEILFEFDKEEDAFQKEIELVNANITDNLCLNIGPGGIGGAKFKGKHHTNETKLKNKEASLNRVWIHNDKESKHPKKEKLEEFLSKGWQLGKHKKDCQFGRKAWNKGLKYTQNNGFVFTEDHKEKISKSLKYYYKNNSRNFGYKHSIESRKKMSENNYLKKNGMFEKEKEKRRIKMKEYWKKKKLRQKSETDI